jgi:hypothetical protein
VVCTGGAAGAIGVWGAAGNASTGDITGATRSPPVSFGGAVASTEALPICRVIWICCWPWPGRCAK